jgi:GTP-binding protein EngB required for normal cell division
VCVSHGLEAILLKKKVAIGSTIAGDSLDTNSGGTIDIPGFGYMTSRWMQKRREQNVRVQR